MKGSVLKYFYFETTKLILLITVVGVRINIGSSLLTMISSNPLCCLYTLEDLKRNKMSVKLKQLDILKPIGFYSIIICDYDNGI